MVLYPQKNSRNLYLRGKEEAASSLFACKSYKEGDVFLLKQLGRDGKLFERFFCRQDRTLASGRASDSQTIESQPSGCKFGNDVLIGHKRKLQKSARKFCESCPAKKGPTISVSASTRSALDCVASQHC